MPPQRGHGSPARVCTRNPSWNEPRAPSTWRKSSIDAPFASIPAASASSIASRRPRPLRPRESARRPQRMDPGAEQCLVGVDVPDSRDPPLVEDERLHGRRSPARDRGEVLGGELGGERLHPEPLVEVCGARPRVRQQMAGAEPPRVDVHEPMTVVELEANSGVRRVGRRIEQQRARSSAGASADGGRRPAEGPGTSRTAPLARRAPRAARLRSVPAAVGLVQRGSRISASTIVRPSRCGASWRRIVSTSGSSGIPSKVVQRNELPGSSVVSGPSSQATTVAPTSAIGPSCRRERWPSNTASSGACSRVWSVRCGGDVAAMIGGQDQQVVVAEQPQPASHVRVDLAQRPMEALGVVPVPVDLVGLDQVREHEPAVERLEQPRGLRERGGVGGARMLRRRRRAPRTAGRPCRPCGPRRRRRWSSSR